MSRISFDLSQFKKDIAKEVNKRYIPGFIRQAAVNANPRIKNAFGDAFERTLFARGLAGNSPGSDFLDVQAQLGFLPSDENDILDRLREVFEDSLNLENLNLNVRNFKVFLTIDSTNLLEDIYSSVDPTYESINWRGESNTVEWLKALTEGWSTPGYDITFDFNNEYYDSRSERAVMIKSTGKIWDSEDYNKFAKQGYDNFIEEAIDDKIFAEEVPRIIFEEFRKVVRE